MTSGVGTNHNNNGNKKKKTYTTVKKCVDGNWAVADAAYRINDCAFIFPITPSSAMGEQSDEFATNHRKNIFGQEMKVIEMQSEAGAGTCLWKAFALYAGASCDDLERPILFAFLSVIFLTRGLFNYLFSRCASRCPCQWIFGNVVLEFARLDAFHSQLV